MPNVETILLVVIGLVVLFVVVAMLRAVRIVPQSYAIIVERLGKFQAEYFAGLHLLMPFIDRVRTTVDLREQVVSFPPQPVITSDNVQVNIDSVIYYQVTDPKRATYEISNYLQAIEQLTVTTLRNVIGAMELEQTLTSRDQINAQLRGVLDQATGRWGIRVANVELKSIDPPASIQGAMEQQMRAERDRRAAILTAEGVKQSQILTAEGDKQSAILRAEGQAQSAILKAQGESRAILQVFDAIHRGNADPKLLAYQYLQTLPKIANGTSSKMWIVPTEFTAALDGIAGALGGKPPSPGSSPFGSGSDDVRVDLSGMKSGLDIASDLAATNLQNPEVALAQAAARSSPPPRRPPTTGPPPTTEPPPTAARITGPPPTAVRTTAPRPPPRPTRRPIRRRCPPRAPTAATATSRTRAASRPRCRPSAAAERAAPDASRK